VGVFVNRHVVAPYVNDLRHALDLGVSLGDHKTALQELLQAKKTGPPDYVLKAESGPDHRKRFLVEVRVAEGSGPKAIARGVGTTKKRAEQEAARRAFEKLRKQGPQAEPVVEGSGS
jgi:ribonuclease-3